VHGEAGPVVLEALATDALRTDAPDDDGHGSTVLRVSLPWIRSLPLASVSALEVRIDGRRMPSPSVVLGDRLISVAQLGHESGWWFVQDRLVLRFAHPLSGGVHRVQLSFRLAIPYLQTGGDAPLSLPFLVERELVAGQGATLDLARDVA